MKKRNTLLLLLMSTGLYLTSCKDEEPTAYVEPTPAPVVPGTVDSLQWPFDACIDTSIIPGNDFYAYISTGYVKKYKKGVMNEQASLGSNFLQSDVANPISENLQKMKKWEDLSAEDVHSLELKAMRLYDASVDTMSTRTMLKELIRNGICERWSFMSAEPIVIARAPQLYAKVSNDLEIDENQYKSLASHRDTTEEYITELASNLVTVNNILNSSTKKTDSNQAKYIKMLQDPTYHPTDIDYDAVDTRTLADMSTRADAAVGEGEQFLLSALGLTTDEASWLPAAATNVCTFITNILQQEGNKDVAKGLAASLKIARIMWSITCTCDNDYKPTKATIGKLFGTKFFNTTLSADYCATKINSADVEACKQLATQFRSTFRDRLDSLDWMSPSTKTYAKKKLDNMYFWYGMPERNVRDFDVKVIDSDFNLSPSDCYMHVAERFHDTILLPILRSTSQDDKSFLVHSSDTECLSFQPNAFYEMTNNMMVILASNLLAPISRSDVSLPYNYAVIGGTTIGHEMCHGFDANGSRYDEIGKVKNWWAVSDALKYKEKQEKMTLIFNQYIVNKTDGSQFQVDGANTLGENMADFGGITIGLDALCRLRKSQGYDEAGIREQMRRYFLAWGLAWSETEPYKTKNGDEHSPCCVRVNGCLNQMDDWYDIFGVKWGDQYYLEPNQRVSLW